MWNRWFKICEICNLMKWSIEKITYVNKIKQKIKNAKFCDLNVFVVNVEKWMSIETLLIQLKLQIVDMKTTIECKFSIQRMTFELKFSIQKLTIKWKRINSIESTW